MASKVVIRKKATVCSCSGSPIVKVKKRIFDEKLKRGVVKETGETVNLYEQIKASDCLTDMALLRKEKMRTGQIPVVDSRFINGVDFSVYPDNIHEVYKVHSQVAERFASLSPEVQKAFNKSVDVFYSACMEGTAKNKITTHYQKLSAEAAKTVEGGN
jgi:hypothetical protein